MSFNSALSDVKSVALFIPYHLINPNVYNIIIPYIYDIVNGFLIIIA